MVKRELERRAYDASRRRRRAEENRERALEVARGLFGWRGYAETTMEAIAGEAGVALPTLRAMFQSKKGILTALMQRLVSGLPGSPPMLDTPGARAVLAETDPRRLIACFVLDLSRAQERVGPTYEVMKSAARIEPKMAELLAGVQAYRYTNIAAVASRLSELGALRPGLAVEDAARTMWALASAEIRQMLETFAQWPVERYRDWLEDTIAAALLQSPQDSGGR